MFLVIAILFIGLGLIVWGLIKFAQGILILRGERLASRRLTQLKSKMSGLDYLYRSGAMSWKEYEVESRKLAALIMQKQ